MSKKVKLINHFDGGMNDASSSRKIEDNQVANAVDVQYRKHGRIEPMGESQFHGGASSVFQPILGEIVPGYGLYHFNTGISFGNTTSSNITSVVTAQGSEGEWATGVGGRLVGTVIGEENLILNRSLLPITVTFKIGTVGEAFGSCELLCTIAITDEDDDYFGFITMPGGGDFFGTDIADVPTTGSYNPYQTVNLVIANAINAGSSNIEAFFDPAANPGCSAVLVASTANATTYNNEVIKMKVTNNLGTTDIGTVHNGTEVVGVNYYNDAVEDYTIGLAHTFYEEPTNYTPAQANPMSGGVANTTHVVTSTVNSVDSSIETNFTIAVGCIEGSTESIQYQTVTAAAGASTSTVATSIRNAINGDISIISQDNIEHTDGTDNADFAAGSGADIVFTTDNSGEDGIFTIDTYSFNPTIHHVDDEIVALVTSTGFFKIVSSNVGVVGSGAFTGSAVDMKYLLTAAQISALSNSLAADNNSFDFATSTTSLVTGDATGFTAVSATFANSSATGKLMNSTTAYGIVTLPIATVAGKKYQVKFDVIAVSTAQVNVSLGTTAAYNSSNKVTSSGAATNLILGNSYEANDTTSFLALQLTTNGSGNYVTIDNLSVYEVGGDETAIWSDANPKTQFYDSGGTLRLYDIDFTHTNNNNKILSYVTQRNIWNGHGASDIDLEKYVLTDQDVSWTFTYNEADDSSPVDGKGFRTRAHDACEGSNVATKEIQIQITTDGDAGLETPAGMWGGTGAENYAFYASAVYDDESETTPDHQFTFTDAGELFEEFNMQRLKLVVNADPGDIDTESNYIAEFRVKAFNIYWSTEKDGYGVKNLLCTLDFKHGCIREDGGATVPWAQKSGDVVRIYDGSNEYVIFNDPVEINTFESRNFYSWQVDSTTAKYKTAVLTGRRAFIGNIKIGENVYNDLIIYSPSNQFDVFPYPDNIIETTTSDGNSITALASTGDRLFEFKQNILYIHNISTGEPTGFFLEATIPFLGTSGQNKIVNVGAGLFWVNDVSAYYFTGDPSNIRDLRFYEGEGNETIERISLSTWQDYVSSDSIVGYDVKGNTIIIKQGATGDSDSGQILQYDLKRDAWSKGSPGKWVPNEDATNFVNLNDGTLINAIEGSYSHISRLQHNDGDESF